MKQIVCVIVCVLAVFTACESKTSESSGTECCESQKDSVETVMNIPVKIKPEFVSAYKAAFDKCQAETLKEEACLAYALFQSYSDSTEFHLFERWANKPGHLAHMETEHLKVFREEIQGTQDQASSRMLEVYVCPILNDPLPR
jgi:Uncharacterized conserved protein